MTERNCQFSFIIIMEVQSLIGFGSFCGFICNHNKVFCSLIVDTGSKIISDIKLMNKRGKAGLDLIERILHPFA